MFKTILVHLRGTRADNATLTAAYGFARPFTAHLEALHVRPDFGAMMARITYAGNQEDPASVAEIIEAMQETAVQNAQRAAETHASFCEKEQILKCEFPPGPGKLNAAFRETMGNELEQLIEQSRIHDLLVIKGDKNAGGLPSDDIGRLIVSTGKPILLAANLGANPMQTVVVAWKSTRETARAVSAAMPLLKKAETIHVMNAEEDGQTSNCDGILTQLAWHGLNAQAHRIEPSDRDPAHAILEACRAASANLLVMGGYGHSRVRETILGGFTRSVLEDASLPVLISH